MDSDQSGLAVRQSQDYTPIRLPTITSITEPPIEASGWVELLVPDRLFLMPQPSAMMEVVDFGQDANADMAATDPEETAQRILGHRICRQTPHFLGILQGRIAIDQKNQKASRFALLREITVPLDAQWSTGFNLSEDEVFRYLHDILWELVPLWVQGHLCHKQKWGISEDLAYAVNNWYRNTTIRVPQPFFCLPGVQALLRHPKESTVVAWNLSHLYTKMALHLFREKFKAKEMVHRMPLVFYHRRLYHVYTLQFKKRTRQYYMTGSLPQGADGSVLVRRQRHNILRPATDTSNNVKVKRKLQLKKEEEEKSEYVYGEFRYKKLRLDTDSRDHASKSIFCNRRNCNWESLLLEKTLQLKKALTPTDTPSTSAETSQSSFSQGGSQISLVNVLSDGANSTKQPRQGFYHKEIGAIALGFKGIETPTFLNNQPACTLTEKTSLLSVGSNQPMGDNGNIRDEVTEMRSTNESEPLQGETMIGDCLLEEGNNSENRQLKEEQNIGNELLQKASNLEEKKPIKEDDMENELLEDKPIAKEELFEQEHHIENELMEYEPLEEGANVGDEPLQEEPNFEDELLDEEPSFGVDLLEEGANVEDEPLEYELPDERLNIEHGPLHEEPDFEEDLLEEEANFGVELLEDEANVEDEPQLDELMSEELPEQEPNDKNEPLQERADFEDKLKEKEVNVEDEPLQDELMSEELPEQESDTKNKQLQEEPNFQDELKEKKVNVECEPLQDELMLEDLPEQEPNTKNEQPQEEPDFENELKEKEVNVEDEPQLNEVLSEELPQLDEVMSGKLPQQEPNAKNESLQKGPNFEDELKEKKVSVECEPLQDEHMTEYLCEKETGCIGTNVEVYFNNTRMMADIENNPDAQNSSGNTEFGNHTTESLSADLLPFGSLAIVEPLTVDSKQSSDGCSLDKPMKDDLLNMNDHPTAEIKVKQFSSIPAAENNSLSTCSTILVEATKTNQTEPHDGFCYSNGVSSKLQSPIVMDPEIEVVWSSLSTATPDDATIKTNSQNVEEYGNFENRDDNRRILQREPEDRVAKFASPTAALNQTCDEDGGTAVNENNKREGTFATYKFVTSQHNKAKNSTQVLPPVAQEQPPFFCPSSTLNASEYIAINSSYQSPFKSASEDATPLTSKDYKRTCIPEYRISIVPQFGILLPLRSTAPDKHKKEFNNHIGNEGLHFSSNSTDKLKPSPVSATVTSKVNTFEALPLNSSLLSEKIDKPTNSKSAEGTKMPLLDEEDIEICFEHIPKQGIYGYKDKYDIEHLRKMNATKAIITGRGIEESSLRPIQKDQIMLTDSIVKNISSQEESQLTPPPKSSEMEEPTKSTSTLNKRRKNFEPVKLQYKLNGETKVVFLPAAIPALERPRTDLNSMENFLQWFPGYIRDSLNQPDSNIRREAIEPYYNLLLNKDVFKGGFRAVFILHVGIKEIGDYLKKQRERGVTEPFDDELSKIHDHVFKLVQSVPLSLQ